MIEIRQLPIDATFRIGWHRIHGLAELKSMVEKSVRGSLPQRLTTINKQKHKWSFLHVGEVWEPYPHFDSWDDCDNRSYRNYIIRTSTISDEEMSRLNELEDHFDSCRISDTMPEDMLPMVYYCGEGKTMLLATRKGGDILSRIAFALKRIFTIFLLAVVVSACSHRTYDTTVQTWNLWSDSVPAPTESGLTGEVIDEGWGVRNVTTPTLTVFPAAHPSGKAVLMCPGGGYYVVCYRHEGEDWAETFNDNGITLAVLRYRLPNGHHQVPLEDGLRAMELLREHADELGIREIGVMGFSAGGHLASTIATHYTSEANRPDFQVLVYPVVSMDTIITHMGSREGLLGYAPADSLVAAYSNELQVTPASPRAFITLSGDDDLVPIANSLRYYQSLQLASVPAELHMYPSGGHGWGFNPTPFHDVLLRHMIEWINEK